MFGQLKLVLLASSTGQPYYVDLNFNRRKLCRPKLQQKETACKLASKFSRLSDNESLAIAHVECHRAYNGDSGTAHCSCSSETQPSEAGSSVKIHELLTFLSMSSPQISLQKPKPKHLSKATLGPFGCAPRAGAGSSSSAADAVRLCLELAVP